MPQLTLTRGAVPPTPFSNHCLTWVGGVEHGLELLEVDLARVVLVAYAEEPQRLGVRDLQLQRQQQLLELCNMQGPKGDNMTLPPLQLGAMFIC